MSPASFVKKAVQRTGLAATGASRWKWNRSVSSDARDSRASKNTELIRHIIVDCATTSPYGHWAKGLDGAGCFIRTLNWFLLWRELCRDEGDQVLQARKATLAFRTCSIMFVWKQHLQMGLLCSWECVATTHVVDSHIDAAHPGW